jgi:hypothetical protein
VVRQIGSMTTASRVNGPTKGSVGICSAILARAVPSTKISSSS